MAQDSSQEKSEKATPKRLRDARKKGQSFKSKDLETVMVFVAIFAAIALFKPYISAQLKELMEATFKFSSSSKITPEEMYQMGMLAFMTMVKVTLPVLTAGFVVALVVGFLQVGPIFSLDPLKPDLKKLNLVENLKNMFKVKTFFELIKNILKIGVVFFIAYLVLKSMLEPFLLTVISPVEGAAKLGEMVLVKFIVRFLIVFLMIAIFDLFMQRKEFMKNLMMSKEEVKREYKEDEGDPLIKGQRRQIHMEMAIGDTRQNVKNADAIVTNPTHLAIAIKYDKKEMVAPQVVAKGQRMYAEFIKDLAKEFDVPIIRNIPLAWSLIELEIGDEIPETLYVAVAEILSFVYKMKEEREKGDTFL